MKRGILLCCLILYLLFSLAGCGKNSVTSHEQAAAYVHKHQTRLGELTQSPDDNWKKCLGPFTIVTQVSVPEAGITQFSCKNWGLVTGSTYAGFYHTQKDVPYAIIFTGVPLTETAPGIYQWQEEGGTHKVHIEKIIDHWYYYCVDWY